MEDSAPTGQGQVQVEVDGPVGPEPAAQEQTWPYVFRSGNRPPGDPKIREVTVHATSLAEAVKKALEEHGFEYDGLHMGKPVADVWIDDRAIRFTNWQDVLAQFQRDA